MFIRKFINTASNEPSNKRSIGGRNSAEKPLELPVKPSAFFIY